MHMSSKLAERAFVKAIAAIAILTATIASPAGAQGILGQLKKAVEKDLKQDTRRCTAGDSNCSPNAQTQPSASVANKTGDHPLITPYQGSTLNRQDRQDYTDYNRVTGMDKSRRAVSQRVEGNLTKLVYNNPKGRSSLEIMRNYKSALEARGFRVDYEHSGGEDWIINLGKYNGMIVYGNDIRYFTGKLKYNDGTAYVSILVYREGSGFGRTNIHVLESSKMDSDMVGIDPSAMADELERSGQINLQGIYFDTGHYALKSESDAALQNVQALMSAQPALRLAIVGHTDSSGDAANNRLLSQKRAESVRAALIARGLSSSRLTAAGIGSSQPIASNASADGRAQNRRVMLIRQ